MVFFFFIQQLRAELDTAEADVADLERTLEQRRRVLAEVTAATEAVDGSIATAEAVYDQVCNNAILRQGYRLLAALQTAAYKEPGYRLGVPWDDYEGTEFYHGTC
jgi:outer membrane protein TolC